MNKALLLAGVAACLFAANANAAEVKQYVSGKLNYSIMDNGMKDTDADGSTEKANTDDNVLGGSFAYGVKADAVRTELELNLHQKAEKKHAATGEDDGSWKSSLENNSIMLNAYYDIETGTKFTPYVGAGVGLARLKAKIKQDDGSVSKSGTNFAWQVGAGVAYAVTDDLSVDLGYRYTDSGDVTKKGVSEDGAWKTKFDSSAHEILLGARYSF